MKQVSTEESMLVLFKSGPLGEFLSSLQPDAEMNSAKGIVLLYGNIVRKNSLFFLHSEGEASNFFELFEK